MQLAKAILKSTTKLFKFHEAMQILHQKAIRSHETQFNMVITIRTTTHINIIKLIT
jgi:hypothetical protein